MNNNYYQNYGNTYPYNQQQHQQINSAYNVQQMIQSIMQTIQLGNNPEMLFNNLAKNNPQVQELLNKKQQNNMSWKDLTIEIAKQNNVDIQPILNGLQNNGIKL